MAELHVTVTVEGGEDIASLVQDELERNLRFRTVGATCEKCKAMEARSDAGQEFDAPPIHRNCDCRLVLVTEDGEEAITDL